MPEIDPYDQATIEYLNALVGSNVAPSAALVERVHRMAKDSAAWKEQAQRAEEE